MNEREELEALRRLAALEAKARIPQDAGPADWAASEMPAWQQAAAGGGKFLYDLARGAGQYTGVIDRKDVDESKERDKALMDQPLAVAGNIGMGLVPAAATALIPGVNTLLGASAIGAGIGALEPTGTGESTLGNILKGGAFGLGGTVAGRLIGSAYQGGKALAEPFLEKGREQIASRVLNRFATDPAKAKAAMSTAPSYVKGSLPTAAEASADPGIAGLQLAARNQPSGSVLKQRDYENAAARVAALREIAGDEGKMAFYKASRDTAAKDLYEKAFSETIQDTPWMKGQITQLMKRPAFVQALKEGQEIAMNEGVKWGKKGKVAEEEAVKVLHYAKMALDDKIAAADGNTKRALIETKDKLLSVLESERAAPSYREARKTYAAMSKPINQMEIGQFLYNKTAPALTDFSEGAITRTKAEQFAQALRNADATVRQALGRPGKMDEIMDPEQMGVLAGVGKDLSRRAVADDMAKTINSTTAQNLAGQNVLRQLLGPTGLPESWAESTLLPSIIGRPVDFLAKRAEPKIQERLVQALLNPTDAAQLMAMQASPEGRAIAAALLRYLPASTATAGLQFGQ